MKKLVSSWTYNIIQCSTNKSKEWFLKLYIPSNNKIAKQAFNSTKYLTWLLLLVKMALTNLTNTTTKRFEDKLLLVVRQNSFHFRL